MEASTTIADILMNDTFLIFGDTSTKLAPHSQENMKAGKS